MSEHLHVDPVLCDAYGYCAELLPEVITRDEWGYPVIDPGPLPEDVLTDARRAAGACPKLALRLELRSQERRRTEEVSWGRHR